MNNCIFNKPYINLILLLDLVVIYVGRFFRQPYFEKQFFDGVTTILREKSYNSIIATADLPGYYVSNYSLLT